MFVLRYYVNSNSNISRSLLRKHLASIVQITSATRVKLFFTRWPLGRDQCVVYIPVVSIGKGDISFSL